jgi:LysR family transcriptional regulator, cys regulon transcriptional activator
MKFQQLRYLVAVHDNDLSISAAARGLHATQPVLSREIKQLEMELGFELFERKGRALLRTTAAGTEIVGRAARIVREMQNIRRVSAELRNPDGGSLSIATTHTQARYVLPEVIRAFRAAYPKVRLHLHQGTAEQIADMMAGDGLILQSPRDLPSYSPISYACRSTDGIGRSWCRAVIGWHRREDWLSGSWPNTRS